MDSLHSESHLSLYAEYEKLKPEEKALLIKWIKDTLTPARTYSYATSYGMKHDFEKVTGLYINNVQFKAAMLLCSYFPKNHKELNWRFKIKRYVGQGTGV